MAETLAPQRMEFKTELKQILDIIIHSLYTKKEVYLRELVSNSADAIDKVRFESLTDGAVLEGNSDWQIRIIPDEKAGTLTVSDNGVGMSRESIVDNLGTIARSGTREFLQKLQQADVKNRPELIGQFGVGFYASFMVADRVTVLSRMAGPKSDGVKWESDGQGSFTVEPYEKETRGTDVILHLRDDAKEFLQPWRLQGIIKQYSDFVEHPIVLLEEKDGKQQETAPINSRQAIWLRPKGEIKPQEYNEFYKQITRDVEDPLKTVHIAAEGGATEFRAVLYIPAHRPLDFLWHEPKAGLQLYVRRVLIMHECSELLPAYLRFVRGVVDSSDLPLNVSREMLQHNPVLARIKSNLVNRVLKTLEEMRDGEKDAYVRFYGEFGALLKEGVTQDFAQRERLADLLLLESTKTEAGKHTTLAEYVARMGSEQKEIYYLIGETRQQIENSPYLEAFKARGEEVLLLTDPIDEFLVQSLSQYKQKTLKAVDKGEVSPSPDEQQKQSAEQLKGLLELLKGKLQDEHVKDVRVSARLKDSAACLVADEAGPSAHLERLMERLGRGEELPPPSRILEINGQHPLIQAMDKLHQSSANDPHLDAYAKLLYAQAVIAEGSKIKNPTDFARQLNDLMLQAIGK
jgi:molecular chaperone HtpG